ncbi:MAG: hypothetical protein LBH19_04865, partial [Dysgonamonadaceae bacterium]|nr:hypothetical protein [Dysgonamonadaceae bacterium]
MKKLSLLLAFVLCVFITVSAQSEERSKGITTKNGTQILPVAGDFAIGVDATPFLDYAGKLLSESGSDAPTFGFGNDGITIYGKYFLAPDRAIRAKLLLDLASTTTHSVAQEIGTSGPVADKYVDNIFKNGRTEIRLNGGYEFRRGYGRLQGFYGAEVGLAYLSTSQSNEYGNALSSNNPLSNRLKESTSGGKFT